jgi:uncharacterized protein YbaP (TraB family)
MWHKIPCKKKGFSVITILVPVVMLLLSSMALTANQDLQADRALFWSIEKNGRSAGHILGTIHSEDPRVLDFSENFLEKLKDNRIFAMELIPDMLTLARLTEYMQLPPGQTLESVIGVDRFKALASALSAYKVPLEYIVRMKPWAAMMTLSTPPPKTGFFMDFSLSLRASGSGLEVVGLETLEQQLSFLENMPMSMQLSLLDQAISEYGRVSEVHGQLVDAYLENDLVQLQALSDEQLQAVDVKSRDYFIESGILARNLRMAEALLVHIENNRVFIAVGALHLPGKNGLLNILRRNGFELSPLDLPFSESTDNPDQ